MRIPAVFALLVLAACATAPPPANVSPRTRAMIEQLTAAVQQQPRAASYLYLLATLHDQTREPDLVVRDLTQLDALGWEYGLAADAFAHTNTPAFREIAAKLDARVPRASNAQRAFTIAGRRDAIPEGIAWDPIDDVFYLTSIHRRLVLRVDRNGNATEFTQEGAHDMQAGLGAKVDAGRRLLWVISSSTPEMRGYREGDERSTLAAYDLRTRALVKKIEATPALLNDLVLLRDGSLFATDMGRGNVMRLAPDANTLEVFADGFQYPNGITISADESTLYVADFRGVTRIDLRDRSRVKLESPKLLGGIDGLSMFEGKLIGIQNAIGKPRVIRIDPANGNVDVLESQNAAFEIPTTGVVAGTDYFFIANPGLKRKLTEDLVMLRLPLTR